MKPRIVLVALVLALAGCATTPADRIAQHQTVFNAWPAEVQAKIRAKYGRWQIRIIPWISRLQGRLKADQTFGDTVVLITVAETSRQTA